MGISVSLILEPQLYFALFYITNAVMCIALLSNMLALVMICCSDYPRFNKSDVRILCKRIRLMMTIITTIMGSLCIMVGFFVPYSNLTKRDVKSLVIICGLSACVSGAGILMWSIFLRRVNTSNSYMSIWK
jgi:hypothetical protein